MYMPAAPPVPLPPLLPPHCLRASKPATQEEEEEEKEAEKK